MNANHIKGILCDLVKEDDRTIRHAKVCQACALIDDLVHQLPAPERTPADGPTKSVGLVDLVPPSIRKGNP